MTVMTGATRPLLALSLLLLAGCNTAAPGRSAETCPAVGVLERAGELTRFAANATRRADVIYEARILDVTPTACRIERDGTGALDLRVRLQLVRGPAATTAEHAVTYFLAVTDAGGQILSREAFAVSVQVPPDRTGANVTEELTLRIPRAEPGALGQDRIDAALQLTAEELEYNRQTGAR